MAVHELSWVTHQGDKVNPHSCVWSDEFDEYLSSYVPQKVLNVFPDKQVLHDGLSAEGVGRGRGGEVD